MAALARLPGTSRTGVEQQPGRELDASGSSGTKKLDPRGSPQAGPKVAAILSVLESCRRLKRSVRNYLASVLPGLADLPIQRVPELTPSAWATQHP